MTEVSGQNKIQTRPGVKGLECSVGERRCGGKSRLKSIPPPQVSPGCTLVSRWFKHGRAGQAMAESKADLIANIEVGVLEPIASDPLRLHYIPQHQRRYFYFPNDRFVTVDNHLGPATCRVMFDGLRAKVWIRRAT